MPNRSNSELPPLPVIYSHVQPSVPDYPAQRLQPGMLQIYDVTFLHFHNLMEIGLCVSGEGICYVEDRAFPFQAGDVQIIFPYQRHLSKNVGEEASQWYWLNVDGPALLSQAGFSDVTALERMLNQEMGLFGIIDQQQYPQVCALARKMVWEVFEPQPERVHREEYYSACYYMLLTELREASSPLQKITAKHEKMMKEIAPALMAVKQAVDEGSLPEVSGLAVLCDMSTSNFRRRFKDAVGVAPKDYITACCIHRACRLLLRTDEKIINIASQCGFLNVSGFNRCFLKFTGISPREYRRRNA